MEGKGPREPSLSLFSLSLLSLSPSLSHSCALVFRPSIPPRRTKGDAGFHSQPFCANHAVPGSGRAPHESHVVTARTRPPAGCLPARPASAGLAPSGLAAGASRHPHDQGAPLPCLSARSHTASHSRVWSRECISRPRLRRSWRARHDPHSGTRDSLPSHARSAFSAFGASGSAASVSRPISGPLPSVHSPLRTYDSALRSGSQRVACLPNRLARVRRGLTPEGPSSLLNRLNSRRFTLSLCPHRAHPAPARPCRMTRAGPPTGGPVRSTPERTAALRSRQSQLRPSGPGGPQKDVFW